MPPAASGVKPDSDLLIEKGCSPDLAADFLKIRKSKRSPLTATAVSGIDREAAKAGISFAEAVRICVERGWQGFNADWIAGNVRGSDSVETDAAKKRRLAEEGARFLGISLPNVIEIDAEVRDA